MEIFTNEPFRHLWQLDLLIDMPIQNISHLLTEYIEFIGLVYDEKEGEEQKLKYVDGIFIQHQTECRGIGFIETEDGPEEDIVNVTTSIIGTKYSNDDSLLDRTLTVKSDGFDIPPMYSYDEFIKVTSDIGIPIIKSNIPTSPPKAFTYNTEQVNLRSNFTVREAHRIASNQCNSPSLQYGHNQHPLCSPEDRNCLQVLLECIKGQNQRGFHLITKVLYSDGYQRPNGTVISPSLPIDIDDTIISKNELIRWCDFMEIETGLTIDDDVENESVEFLKLEVERLRKLAFPKQIPPQQFPPPVVKKEIEIVYPPELQLAIDAHNEFLLSKQETPIKADILEWLKSESENRGITHKDGGQELKGLSQTKSNAISSMIR